MIPFYWNYTDIDSSCCRYANNIESIFLGEVFSELYESLLDLLQTQATSTCSKSTG